MLFIGPTSCDYFSYMMKKKTLFAKLILRDKKNLTFLRTIDLIHSHFYSVAFFLSFCVEVLFFRLLLLSLNRSAVVGSMGRLCFRIK